MKSIQSQPSNGTSLVQWKLKDTNLEMGTLKKEIMIKCKSEKHMEVSNLYTEILIMTTVEMDNTETSKGKRTMTSDKRVQF